jgi:Na+/H+ antiporter NhaC
MNQRLSHNMLIYTFAVFMILMRPFFAYHISQTGGFANDPTRVYNLLQRLVKKKEFHAEDADEAADLIRATEIEVILPVVFLILQLRRRAGWLYALLFGSNTDSNNYSTTFQVCPCNSYYQRISKLQI